MARNDAGAADGIRAAIGLLLTSIGVYGVLAYYVTAWPVSATASVLRQGRAV